MAILAVALDGDLVVAFASAVHHVHPDKPPPLWINVVGVAPGHREQNLARRLRETLFGVGRATGCSQAFLLRYGLAVALTRVAGSLIPSSDQTLLLAGPAAEPQIRWADYRVPFAGEET